jgi:hypothetical protein
VTALEIGLGGVLGLALVAVVFLAAVLPRRVARLVSAEYARADTRALAAKAALHAASSAEVAVIVAPLRAMSEDQARLTGGLRSLVEWLVAFTNAQYAQAVAAARSAPGATPELDRPARARPSPQAPALAPPGSAEPWSPEPAQRAAGLTRPAAPSRPPPESGRPRATVLGLAPVGTPRRVAPSAPTLISMAAVTPPAVRPAPSIAIEGTGEEKPGDGGAA